MDCYDTKYLPQMFDSFCKTVLRNEARDYYRKKVRDEAHEMLVSSFEDEAVGTLGVWDEYPSTVNVCKFCEYEIVIEDDKLFIAVDMLPELNKCIVLLHECLLMSDAKIGEKLGMNRGTVRNRRVASTLEIREYYEQITSDRCDNSRC